MIDMLNFISNNALISALIATTVIAIANRTWKWQRNRNDSQAIYTFLLNSKTDTGFTFRSTETISAHTKIPESRVADLCSNHPKIRRNEKEKQSWRLAT